MTEAKPRIWVLEGVRAGDTAQAVELAQRVATATGAVVERKPLAFNALHVLPNNLTGGSLAALTADARSLLCPPWPNLVIATGKRTAPVAVWVRQQAGPQTRIVQLGRPRMNLRLFDLVITTPQYGLPAGPNIVQLPLPFAAARPVPPEDVARQAQLWAGLPRPWHIVVVGGGKFPLRLGPAELTRYAALADAMAKAAGGSLMLIDSPRSPEGALALMAQQLAVPHWVFRRGQDNNPYQPALALGDVFCVTSDSVSMVTEMLGTGKPVHVFMLPEAPLSLRWRAESGLAARLARRGMLAPPRNVPGLMRGLVKAGVVGDLQQGSAPSRQADVSSHQQAAVERVSRLLRESSLAHP